MRLRRTRRLCIVMGVATVSLAALASGAAPVRAQSQQPAPEPSTCQGCQPPLSYHGGPVLDTNGLTITPIYWAPSGYSFPATYTTIINQYLSDVAADSGKSSNAYAIDNEYYQQVNGSQTNISYKITAGTPITTTDAFPQTANPCDVHTGYTACVNGDQIQSELASVIAANNLTADMNNIYVVLFPQGVQTFEGGARSQEVYCGIHQSFTLPNNGGTVLYADEPYITSCSAGQAPNGDAAADTEVSVMSHEISETMTDPVSSSPSWYDSTGNEIGDECNFNYGPPTGSTDPNNPQTTEYNQVINGHDYYVQTMFSNAAFSANGTGNGCLTSAFNSTSTTAFKAASPDSPAQATLDASETKLPADGTSTSTVTLTVVDDSGEPVSGDHIHFDVSSSDEAPGTCGTVNPTDGSTDDNGQVTTTYTASTDNAGCIIYGIDAESGASDWGTIYQGSAGDDQPAITDASVPNSLTPGGDSDTFTVTAKNPSSTDIADARFDVFLTGDDNSSTGLTSKEVHIAYSDDTTGGKYVDIPLTGETVKDGEIDGYVMPDKAASLPAGASRTVTFQISLDGSAPSTKATGQPLHIETDFDQVDPADGSTDNLDYEGPDDVTVTAAGSSSSSSGGGFPLVIVIVIVVVVIAAAVAAFLTLSRRRPRPAAR